MKYGSLQPETMTTSNQEEKFVAAVKKKKRIQKVCDIFIVI
jgi:hypothetical protein